MDDLVVAVDIETIPDEEQLENLPEVKPKANLKDARKIEEDLEAKRVAQREKMALSPFSGRMCAFATTNGKEEYSSVEGCGITTEESMLKELLDIICHSNRIVTFNGKQFDLPFILVRSMLLGISSRYYTLNPSKMLRRFDTIKHYDLMEVLSFNSMDRVQSLAFYAKRMLGVTLAKEDYSQFSAYLATIEGRERIREHVLGDVRATWNIYLVTRGYLGEQL
jgi:DNA polymerase elongation subunit (family B)